ncbi:hypothetical protein [Comamonas composti]|uniref:hypothetical protein n=1 Tax=Comamonas composti TaxID=408558 RepID=UPI00146FB22E|nr:hypothetical protein [Comamonas composti]
MANPLELLQPGTVCARWRKWLQKAKNRLLQKAKALKTRHSGLDFQRGAGSGGPCDAAILIESKRGRSQRCDAIQAPAQTTKMIVVVAPQKPFDLARQCDDCPRFLIKTILNYILLSLFHHFHSKRLCIPF